MAPDEADKLRHLHAYDQIEAAVDDLTSFAHTDHDALYARLEQMTCIERTNMLVYCLGAMAAIDYKRFRKD